MTSGAPAHTVSVVVAAYRAERFLHTALASVAGQTRPPDEVIVVDDASPDRSAEVAERWRELLPLTVIRKPVNEGVGAARRTAIEAATGTAIATLDSDDAWLPDHLEVALSLLADDRTIVAQQLLRWRPGRSLGSRSLLDLLGGLPTQAAQPASIVQANFLSSGSLFTRAAYLEAGGCSDRRHNEDWDLWIRMIELGCRAVPMSHPTALYRLHEGSLSANDALLDADVELLEEVRRRRTGDDRLVVDAALRRRRARMLLLEGLEAERAGDRARGRRLFLRALLLDRSLRGGTGSLVGSVSLRAAAALVQPRRSLARRDRRVDDTDLLQA